MPEWYGRGKRLDMLICLNGAWSGRNVFWSLGATFFEITVLKKESLKYQSNSLRFQLLTLQPSEATWELSRQTTQNGQFLSMFLLLLCTKFDLTASTPETFWMSFSCLACKTWLLLVVLDREQTRPLLQHSPGSTGSMFSSHSTAACFLVAERLSSWLEVRFQILSLLPQALAFPGCWLLASACSPGCFSQDVTLHRELRCQVALDFLAGAKEQLDSAETNLCIPAFFIRIMLPLIALGHELCCGGLPSQRVQRVEIVYTAPNMLLQMV